MIAAIYACKSTDDSEKDPVAKSTQLQIDGATAYAAKQAGRSTPAGAEWTRRPGFNALLATLDPSPPFGVVIASELSRIGHNTVRTPAAVMRIEEAARARLGSPSQAPSLRRAERRTRCADGDEALPAADRTRPARGREGRAHAL